MAQAAVLVAGAATTVLVAAIVGPPLFREHLHRAGVAHDSGEQMHAEEAYRYATAIAVGVALAAAVLTALVVTWFFSRRLQRSLAEVSSAAAQVANGRYDVRVSPPRLGADFDAVASAFNTMATRLESVETTRRRLLGDLAHEIRTPVSVLDAYMEALEDGVKDLDADTAALLRDQTARLVRFSDDVAALTRAEEGRESVAPESVKPQALIASATASAAARCAAEGISLDPLVPPGLPPIWGDPVRLGQVLGNVVDNAIRHTPAGGRITVAAAANRDRLTITVTDTGDGIAADHLDHVFERFYRVDSARDRSRGGSGIGLSIAKAIVEAHGGRITVRSDGPGTGATFAISLPLARSDGDPTRRTAQTG
jgi:signal transduction histidine kinase